MTQYRFVFNQVTLDDFLAQRCGHDRGITQELLTTRTNVGKRVSAVVHRAYVASVDVNLIERVLAEILVPRSVIDHERERHLINEAIANSAGQVAHILTIKV